MSRRRKVKHRDPARVLRALTIKAHCDAAGLGPHDIEKLTGWHELRVWRLFAGVTSFSVDDMSLLAKLMGKSVDDLLAAPHTKTEASA